MHEISVFRRFWQLLRAFFHVFGVKGNLSKFLNTLFLGLRKFSNLSVLHKGLLMQDWVFRLGMGEKSFKNTSVESYHFMIAMHLCFTNVLFKGCFDIKWNGEDKPSKYWVSKTNFGVLIFLLLNFCIPVRKTSQAYDTITFTSIKEIIEFDILI